MKVNPVRKSISEAQRAYLAGLIDGDGAIMALIEKHSEKRFGFRVRIEIKITQTHKKDVLWLKKFTGIGYIRKNIRTYEWIVRDQKAVKWLAEKITPYTHGKKKQLEYLEKIFMHPNNTKSDLIKIARLADTLSSFNVRSRNRRKNFATMIQEIDSPND